MDSLLKRQVFVQFYMENTLLIMKKTDGEYEMRHIVPLHLLESPGSISPMFRASSSTVTAPFQVPRKTVSRWMHVIYSNMASKTLKWIPAIKSY
jgi:hypothetical protein